MRGFVSTAIRPYPFTCSWKEAELPRYRGCRYIRKKSNKIRQSEKMRSSRVGAPVLGRKPNCLGTTALHSNQ